MTAQATENGDRVRLVVDVDARFAAYVRERAELDDRSVQSLIRLALRQYLDGTEATK